MMRKFFPERQFYRDNYGFRWRGSETTRLEGFSDAVFAFSVTLLIVSLEVPKTFAELMHTMQGFVAFAASFAILLWIWHVHYLFFRRYGLQDRFTKTMNAILLFVVLFYVYPLKFVFTNVISLYSSGPESVILRDGSVAPIIQQGDPSRMMVIYGVGFIAVFLVYTLLYVNAYRKRDELRLSELETELTKMGLRQYVICMIVGGISIAVAFFGGDGYASLSGISYGLLGPFLAIHGFMSGKKIDQIREKMNLAQAQRSQHQQQRQQQPQQRQFQQQPPRQQNQPRGPQPKR